MRGLIFIILFALACPGWAILTPGKPFDLRDQQFSGIFFGYDGATTGTIVESQSTGGLRVRGEIAGLTFTIGENTVATGTLTVTGLTKIGAGSPSVATAAGELYATGDLEVDGVSNLAGAITAGSNYTGTGFIKAGGGTPTTATGNGDIYATDALEVDGVSELGGAVTGAAGITASGLLSSGFGTPEVATSNGDVYATDALEAEGVLDVGGAATFGSTGTFTGNVTSPNINNMTVFNAKDYGAVGDGVADDTAEIQACVDAAIADAVASYNAFFAATGIPAARGVKVQIPKGKYKISSPILFAITGASQFWNYLEVEGVSGVPLIYTTNTDGTGDIFTITQAGPYAIQTAFSNLTLRGTTTNRDGIRATGISKLLFDNCTFTNMGGAGLYLDATYSSDVNLCEFYGNGTGIKLRNSAGNATCISNSKIFTTVGIGIDSTLCSSLNINNCDIETWGTGAILLDGVTQAMLTGNYFEHTTGYSLKTTNTSHNITFMGNTLSGGAGNIPTSFTATTSNIHIGGNRCYNTTAANMLVVDSACNNVTWGMNGVLGTAVDPNPDALQRYVSTTKGVRFPSMTTTQRNAISGAAAGLTLFNTTTGSNEYYNGSAWITSPQNIGTADTPQFTKVGINQAPSATARLAATANGDNAIEAKSGGAGFGVITVVNNAGAAIGGFRETSGSGAAMYLYDSAPTLKVRLDVNNNSYYNGSGNFGIGNASPGAKLDVTGTALISSTLGVTGIVTTGGIIVPTSTPASASAAGTAGTITWDANFLYCCTATNTWKRVAIATW